MKNKYGIVIILGIVLSLVSVNLFSTETLIKIANDSSMNYQKPEVKISPNGTIYIVYKAEKTSSGKSDIYISKYNEGKVSFVRNISNSSQYSYEPEIDIRNNGDIHVAWCDQSGSNHYIKHSYYNGSTWSSPITLGQVNSEGIEDLRMAVDDSGNVFVVFMYWPDAKCKFISKYGNIISFKDFPLSGRSKHPDVFVDNNYIHIVWQYKYNRDYVAAYQRRANSRNSNWENLIIAESSAVQRPRGDVDNSGTPHIIYQKGIDPDRTIYYEYRNGGSFSGHKKVSETAAYYYIDISAAFSNNLIITMKKGRLIYYNWNINGSWSGYTILKKSVGARTRNQSVDLDKNSLQVAIAFSDGDNSVNLVLLSNSGQVEPGAPVASFTLSPQSGHIPFNVEFDASSSSSSNGTIVSWAWNFGDGGTASGQTASHTYSKAGNFIVTLTVTDSNGKTGTTLRTVNAIKVNTPPIAFFTYSPKSGLYPLNVTINPSKSVDSDGVIEKYIWDFGDGKWSTKTSGTLFSYKYDRIGNFNIKLFVYDNNGGKSQVYSQFVFVYGVEPPVNVKYEIKENRTLFTVKYVTKLTWDSNKSNMDRGVNIAKYKILRKRKEESNYSLIAEIDFSSKRHYDDRIGSERIEYDYKVVAVTDGGRESS